jgi:hypothetical protein
LLVKIGEFSHKEAWLLTMLWTGILNYFLLKSAWKSGDSKIGEGKDSHGKLEV